MARLRSKIASHSLCFERVGEHGQPHNDEPGQQIQPEVTHSRLDPADDGADISHQGAVFP